MRIFFLESHPMWINGLPNGFLDLGHQIRISGPIGKNVFPSIMTEFNPDLAFTMSWTFENGVKKNQESIYNAVSTAQIPHVYWDTEGPADFETFVLPYIRTTQPNFIFTIFPERIKEYKKLGFRSAYLDFGYHPSVHHPVAHDERFASPLNIVANGYPKLLKQFPNCIRNQMLNLLVRPILEAGLRVNFYGRGWDAIHHQFYIPKEWIHGYLPYMLTSKVYSSSDIVIGLQDQQTRLTQRTYEILASGGLLLTGDTPALREVGINEKDYISSSSPDETLKLVRHYLNHPEERKAIQANARFAVAKHTYTHRAEYIIEILRSEGLLKNVSKNLGTANPISFGPTGYEQVALTFNMSHYDDKNLSNLIQLLEILNKNKVKATFFITGKWAKTYPQLIKQIIADGHEFGNLSYHYIDLTKLPYLRVVDEIAAAEKIFLQITGMTTRPHFRPPFMNWNKSVLQAASDAGFSLIISASIDIDARVKPLLVNKILDEIKDGEIISINLSTPIKIIQTIITNFKTTTLKLVKVRELLRPRHFYG